MPMIHSFYYTNYSMRLVHLFIWLLAATSTCVAQWVRQDILLKPGWNAVFLEVQPEPDDPDIIFDDLPIESVWQWNRTDRRVDFLKDPDEITPLDDEWSVHLPVSNPGRAARSLFSVSAGRALLVRLKGPREVVWSVTGRPVPLRPKWIPDSLNLVGVSVTPNTTHTFKSYFASSPAHRAMRVFRLDPSGKWTPLDPAGQGRERIESGRAYWVGISGSSDFFSPLSVETDQVRGMNFGTFVSELGLSVGNRGVSPDSVSIFAITSAKGGQPSVPLEVRQFDPARLKKGETLPAVSWIPLMNIGPLSLSPGEDVRLRMAVRRDQMKGLVDQPFESVLEVRDSMGTRAYIGVSALGNPRFAVKTSGLRGAKSVDTSGKNAFSGLWVGSASIRSVNHTGDRVDRESPRPVGREFEFRLIVHVDGKGQARLLQKVFICWKKSNDGPDGSSNGQHVLFADETAASAAGYIGTVLRDGVAVPRRISSPAFSFRKPVSITSVEGFGTGIAKCDISVGFDDPLNPFVHRPHPDHNNLDEQDPPKPLKVGEESFTINRSITLMFSNQDPTKSSAPGWGDTRIGGEYIEEITGVHAAKLSVKGIFLLNRASGISEITDLQ